MHNKSLSPEERFVHNAAFLRREFLGRNLATANDRKRANTIYFYDTDVVVAYCEPWIKGPDLSAGGHGYGAIFPPSADDDVRNIRDEETERAIYTSSILSEYVFTRLRSAPHPAYQFSCHFDETTNIYERNAQRLARTRNERTGQKQESRDERLRRAAALLGARSTNETATQLMPELIHILQLMSPLSFPLNKNDPRHITRSWERFINLNTITGGIFNAKYAAAHFQSHGSALVDALKLLETGPEYEEQVIFDVLKRHFVKRLSDHAPPDRVASRDRDAEAITTLYLLNARLRKSNTDWRAIFITGARGLAEAGYGHLPEVSGINRDVATNFSQQFIRHLWAYTTEALLEPDSSTPHKFINWLDGLLATVASSTDYSETNLTDLILHPGKYPFSSQTLPTILAYWNSLSDRAIATHKLEALGVNGAQALYLQHRILSRVGHERSASWDALLGTIHEEYHRSKDRTFLDFSNVGKDAIFYADGIGQRNPPDLEFRSLKQTNKIFQRLCDNETYSYSAFQSDYKNVELDCHDSSVDGDDRQLSHLRFLVLGAVFAGANKWGVALSQGRRAIAIVERSLDTNSVIPVKQDDSKTYMSGREAYFLCAVATRVISTDRHDLDVARSLLKKSELALRKDKERELSAGNISFVRFECEYLEIALAEYYLERKRRDLLISNNRFADELIDSIYSSCSTLLKKIDEDIDGGISGIINCFQTSPRLKIGRVTAAHISINIIQVCVIRTFRRLNNRQDSADFIITADIIRMALRTIDFLLNPTPAAGFNAIRPTPILILYRDAAARLLGENHEINYASDDDALDALFSQFDDHYVVSSYDDWRFSKLKELGITLNNKNETERRSLLF